jgi:lyso-ornithine lipid O-acyltransferase
VIFRALWRAVALAFVIGTSYIRYLFSRLTGPMTLERRAQWMHSTCRLAIATFGIHLRIKGRLPANGLLVSNHLSYLDILVYGAAVPCFFVSKSEVSRWPFFGALGRAGGTLFLVRSSRASTEQVAAIIAERLPLPVPILFFPEGTSTDGTHLLKFHPRFYQPAILASAPVTAAAVRYYSNDGLPESELCWYGDAPFTPHLWKTLCSRGFSAEVTFGEPNVYLDRRTASSLTHAEIAAMRKQAASS